MIDYSRKLNKNEIFVAVHYDNCEKEYTDLNEEMIKMAKKFGFTFNADNTDLPNSNQFLLTHLIYLSSNTDIVYILQKSNDLFSHFKSISIGIIYDSYEEMLANKETVDTFKKLYPHINFLRCDIITDNGACRISREKILDNAVCDTVRIKYHPQQVSKNIDTLILKYQDFFLGASRIYNEYKLYHRSPKDGFLSIRCPEGFLITATHTYKNTIDLERITLVHHYDEETNTISYSGKFLPSSDVVEASVVYAKVKDVQAIIHTHASDIFTRNKKHANKILIPRNSYGIPELGHQIAKVIGSYLNNFLIMEEHGELFSFTNQTTHQDLLMTMENIILENR